MAEAYVCEEKLACEDEYIDYILDKFNAEIGLPSSDYWRGNRPQTKRVEEIRSHIVEIESSLLKDLKERSLAMESLANASIRAVDVFFKEKSLKENPPMELDRSAHMSDLREIHMRKSQENDFKVNNNLQMLYDGVKDLEENSEITDKELGELLGYAPQEENKKASLVTFVFVSGASMRYTRKMFKQN